MTSTPNSVRTLWLVLGLALAGCGGAMEETNTGPPMIASASPDDQQCTRDAQCVLVQDCCGCQRAGAQLAVHRDRVTELRAAAEGACASVSCTVRPSEHRSCRASRAACLGGRCVPQVE
ncbi:MAG: hypothetical protein IT378_03310 [Sandaracinaceae bacterium]|nr:hypothetical protein [Sandaracinaceae bacterium]